MGFGVEELPCNPLVCQDLLAAADLSPVDRTEPSITTAPLPFGRHFQETSRQHTGPPGMRDRQHPGHPDLLDG
jgi:hypothetical protein